jgi:putative DNA primase/helicase
MHSISARTPKTEAGGGLSAQNQSRVGAATKPTDTIDRPMPDTTATSTLQGALELYKLGYWPIAIRAIGETIGDRAPSRGKDPIGKAWGVDRWSESKLRQELAGKPARGIGICFGPGRGPNGEWLIDLDGDGPKAAHSLAIVLGTDQELVTPAWDSRRGGHIIFVVQESDGLRLLGLLGKAGAREGKGAGAGVWRLDDALPDLEWRIGGYKDDGAVKQVQSVVPPTRGEDGAPRVWRTGPSTPVAELPESAYAILEELAKWKGQTPATPPQPAEETRPSKVRARGPTAEERARKYLDTINPAISGQRGHDTLFRAACMIGPGFDLLPDVAFQLVRDHYNHRCQPPWSDNDIRHKIDDAYREETRRGFKLDSHAKIVEAPDDPHGLARIYIDRECKHKGRRTLVYHRGEFFSWTKASPAYRSIPDYEITARLTASIKSEFDRVNRTQVKEWEARGQANGRDKPIPKVLKVTRTIVANADQALRGISLIDRALASPAWLINDPPFPASDVLPMHNALVHLPSYVEGKPNAVHEATPDFLCPYALDYDFDPAAPPPEHLEAFLKSVWPNDPEAIDTLQEWVGYLLTPDTRQQKIGMFIGPKRSGRGTIGRLIESLLGPDNVVGLSLSGLASNFGVWPLIGKPVGIVGDARISGRSDTAAIVERLLGISGEDTQTIDRKHLPLWMGRLPTRLMIFANELPQLPDQSEALASRYIMFRFVESFIGREDLHLIDKLRSELPGILLWAIDGWKRLRERGRFVQPKSGASLIEEVRDINSPVGAFVRGRCEVGAGLEIQVGKLFQAWCDWCAANRHAPGGPGRFGRNLRTVIPSVDTKVQRDAQQSYVRMFQGVALKP